MAALGVTFCRVIVGALLLWAGAAKIPEPELFAETVRAYDVLPTATVHVFAIVVPWLEVVCGALLISGLWSRSASVVTLGLLVSFAVALGVNIYRGADFSCGCFGVDGGGGSLESAAVRVAVMMGMSGVVLAMGGGRWSADGIWAKKVKVQSAK